MWKKQETEEIPYIKTAYLDRVDSFDCQFFGILPNEARYMDPRQRLFLETAWSTLEDAGYGGDKLRGTRTGIYLGLSSDGSNEYFRLIEQGAPSFIGLSTAGNIKSIIASRLSYILDLQGPSMIIDTACSSSLVALHIACQALRDKQCDAALVGGVNLKIFPKTEKEHQGNIGNASSDFKIKAFDDKADGTISGEGVASILIKPLAKAIRDRDHIYAVIKGSSINQDGSSIGITAPNVLAQEKVILEAWKEAKIDPETISYIEAHGTGTKLGDPIEVSAIQGAFEHFTDKKQFCAIGSSKTNIGHMDSLAGLAGLIKAVLALKHKKLPPSLNFHVPNRNINFSASPVYVNDRLSDWKTEHGFYRCGISSFGLSGTNCHVILEETPQQDPSDQEVFQRHLFTLSAKTESALKKMISKYIAYLRGDHTHRLSDICYTVNTGRGAYSYRFATFIATKTELIENLEAFLRELKSDETHHRFYQKSSNDRPRIAKYEIDEAIMRIKRSQDEESWPIFEWLCRIYCSGEAIEFDALYERMQCQKLSLPTYSFDSKRLWVEFEKRKEPVSDKSYPHPIMQQQVLKSMNLEVYVSYLRVQEEWVLHEHQVNGAYVVPGTTYLDMARDLGGKYFGPEWNITLKNVMFYNLLAIEEDEVREVHTTIGCTNSETLEFHVVSKDRENEWMKHAEAVIIREPKQIPQHFDMDQLKKNYSEVYIINKPGFQNSSIANYASVHVIEDKKRPESIVAVGDRWKCTNVVYANSDSILCEIELPEYYRADLHTFFLHPAMLDCAVNAGTFMLDDATYLPYSYKEFKIAGPTPSQFYSYLLKKSSENEETGRFDIFLLTPRGEVFGQISNYIVKKADILSLSKGLETNLYHQLNWIAAKANGAQPKPNAEKSGPILLFKEENGFSDKLADALRNQGRTVIEVTLDHQYSNNGSNRYTISGTEEDYQQLFTDIKNRGITQIVHLLTFGQSDAREQLDQLELHIFKGVDSLLYMTKAMIKQLRQPVELLLISDYAYQVSGLEETLRPHNAAFFGMGKVVGKEYTKIRVRCMDTDRYFRTEDALAEINTEKEVEHIAYRKGQRFVQQLQKINLQVWEEKPSRVKPNGVYVITGGLGGIGLEIAKFLSSQANVHLQLIGRSPATSQHGNTANKAKVIEEIRASGSTLDYYQANVAELKEMEAVISDIKTRYGCIDGVIHSAGVAGGGLIINKNKGKFDEVIRPKIQGTWIINQLTASEHLDFFIMFSSISSLNGSMGQSDYTAANSYLDSFVDYRKLIFPEQKTLTINWPGWNDVGMLVNYLSELNETDYRAQISDDSGFRKINTQDAIHAFEKALNKDISKIIIGELDYQSLAKHLDQIDFELSSDIMKPNEKDTSSNGKEDDSHAIAKVDYQSIEGRISKAWMEALGLEEIDVKDKFYELGGDSISAIYLVKEIEKEFPSLIDISDVFTYPSISEMSEYIKKSVSPREPNEAAVPTLLDFGEEEMDEILSRLASGEMDLSEATRRL